MTRYSQEIESSMRLYFSGLNEKDRRHYVGAEAIKLGYGGKKYMVELFGISDHMVRRGVQELLNPKLLEKIPEGKIRQKGGGRKKKRRVNRI